MLWTILRGLRVGLGCALSLLGASVSSAETVILLESEAGEPIGRGRSLRLDESRGPIVATLNPLGQGLDDIAISYRGPEGQFTVTLAPAEGQPLVPGTYEDAGQWPFQPPRQPGIAAFGFGIGCESSGRFVIHEVAISDGIVERFSAEFEQHCDGERPKLLGVVRFNAGPPTPDSDGDGVLDPPDNCPSAANPDQADLDQDALGDACDPGLATTYVSLQSEPGDPVGQGRDILLGPNDGPFALGRNFGGGISFSIGGYHFDFAPAEETRLGVRAYPNAAIWPVTSGTAPGMRISGPGGSCFSVTGRFDVLELAVSPYDGAVQRLALDFEQHCNGGAAALFGVIRYRVDADAGAFDVDGDGVINPADNCPSSSNPDQLDRDRDALGDACDLCASYATDENRDFDRNGIGDACECGDQSMDGTVNVIDIVAMNGAIFGSGRISALCDTNADDRCDVRDMIGVSRKLFGIPAHCSRNPTPDLEVSR